MEYELGEGGFGRVIAATRKADNMPVRYKDKNRLCDLIRTAKSPKFQ